MYECIKSQPFQIHDGEDDLTQVFFNPDYEGYLIKEGNKLENMTMYRMSRSVGRSLCWQFLQKVPIGRIYVGISLLRANFLNSFRKTGLAAISIQNN